MKTYHLPLLLPLLLAACSHSDTVGTTRVPQPTAGIFQASTSTSTAKWLIELESDPTALSAQSIGEQQASFRAQATKQGIHYTELRSYHTLFNGFEVSVSDAEISRLSRLPGVKAVYPVETLTMPEPNSSLLNNSEETPETFTSKEVIGVNVLRKDLGLTGKNVKVAVIDSGLDFNHPAFKNGERIIAKVDFVGDNFGKEGAEPVRGDNPQDCFGHGTHVAGIIGGYDPKKTNADGESFSGVAPDVQLGIYRVLGCAGSTNSAILIDALEQAYLDHMQVVNISIGNSFNNWAAHPAAIVADRMIKKGMVVVASAGNSGTKGAFSMGGVGMGRNVISVASVDKKRRYISASLDKLDKNALPQPAPTNTISKFTSYGLSAELELKPNLSAPGGTILSTYPVIKNTGGYMEIDGTSQAAPHVTGLIALMLQGKPNLSPKEIRERLMNTASIREVSKAIDGKSLVEPAIHQGAGLINAVAAYTSPVSIHPTELSLRDSAHIPAPHKVITLKNTTDAPLVYMLQHRPAVTLSGTVSPESLDSVASITVNNEPLNEPRRITLPPNSETELNLVFTPPSNVPDWSQYSGFLEFSSSLNPTMSVPYAGITGDYLQVPSFGSIEYRKESVSTPVFTDPIEQKNYARDAAAPETMPDFTFENRLINPSVGAYQKDEPGLRIHFAHQIRTFKIDVLNEEGVVVRNVHTQHFVSRSCSNKSWHSTSSCSIHREYTWDGLLDNKTPAPAGIYQLRATALKPLGDENISTDTETYLSPKFRVIRP